MRSSFLVLACWVGTATAQGESDDFAPPPARRPAVDSDPALDVQLRTVRRAAQSGDCVTAERVRARIAARSGGDGSYAQEAAVVVEACQPANTESRAGFPVGIEGALRLGREGIAPTGAATLYSAGFTLSIGPPRRWFYGEAGVMLARALGADAGPRAWAVHGGAGTELCFDKWCASAGARIELVTLTEADATASYNQIVIAFPARVRFGGRFGIAPFVAPGVAYTDGRVGSEVVIEIGVELSAKNNVRSSGRPRSRATRSGHH